MKSKIIPSKSLKENGLWAIRDGIKNNPNNLVKSTKKPKWLKVGLLKTSPTLQGVVEIVNTKNLNTVCEEAKCPNLNECWSHGTATFMLLGSVCTRACKFCAVDTGNPKKITDKQEPARVARSVASMKLKYVVLRDQTSENDDIDILVNNYFLFKRISDCHSYKFKNLNLISNSGDPVEDNGIKVSNYIKIKNKIIKLDVRFIGDGYFDINWQKKILNNRKYHLGYYIPNHENFIYSLLYHIVYHKGYIDKKYINVLKKNFKLKTINLKIITKIIDNYLSSKKFKIMRPLDLTIPVTYELDDFSLKKEIQLIKNQIDNRNFSGANKMLYNIMKFQKCIDYLKKDIFFLIFLNQFSLIKFKLKRFIFRHIRINN